MRAVSVDAIVVGADSTPRWKRIVIGFGIKGTQKEPFAFAFLSGPVASHPSPALTLLVLDPLKRLLVSKKFVDAVDPGQHDVAFVRPQSTGEVTHRHTLQHIKHPKELFSQFALRLERC